jgi:hypothetical protein
MILITYKIDAHPYGVSATPQVTVKVTRLCRCLVVCTDDRSWLHWPSATTGRNA